MTTDEWLALYEDNKEDIRRLIRDWHPALNTVPHRRDRITAPEAEQTCESIRQTIREMTTEDPLAALDRAVAARELPEAINIVNEAWFGIPESTDSRGLKGFFVLCELCSEWDEDFSKQKG
jgi:hypothetical protein